MLKAVGDDGKPPLSHDELMERGNELVTKARESGINAIRKSMVPEFVKRGQPLQKRDMLRWRYHAREAITAWREVEGHLTELINEIDKKDAEHRASLKPVLKTDDGVHYRTEWVKKDGDDGEH